MTFRQYLTIMGMASVTAWVTWLIVLMAINPVKAGSVAMILFYLTLSIALVGTLSILGTGFRVWTKKNTPIFRHASKAFRHSILLTFLIIAGLILLAKSLFTWWLVSFLVLLLALIELTFISYNNPSQQNMR